MLTVENAVTPENGPLEVQKGSHKGPIHSLWHAGGEEGPVHSAGMKLVSKVPWPVADLRVDWTEDCPIEALAQLWELYKPQLDVYVARALDPSTAPSYGVPGDE